MGSTGLDVLDEPRPDLRGKLFREVLLSNSFRDFVRHCVRGHTNIDALATSILHDFLVIQLQLFCEIVDSYLLLNCRHNLI